MGEVTRVKTGYKQALNGFVQLGSKRSFTCTIVAATKVWPVLKLLEMFKEKSTLKLSGPRAPDWVKLLHSHHRQQPRC